jgi:hypothetical protein
VGVHSTTIACGMISTKLVFVNESLLMLFVVRLRCLLFEMVDCREKRKKRRKRRNGSTTANISCDPHFAREFLDWEFPLRAIRLVGRVKATAPAS